MLETVHPTDDTSADLAKQPFVDIPGPIEIWTDGSCQPNPGRGGWAAILQGPDGTEKQISGAEARSTNNRMELMAAIQALNALPEGCTVVLHADSQYVVKGMTEWLRGWVLQRWRTSAGKPVQNADLWMLLQEAAKRHRVEWRWVRGHGDAVMNIRVDDLANAARKCGPR